MNLSDIVSREPVPEPWAEGYKIPWDEPGFSERMLPWHLSQDTDAASRRSDRIDRHVAWINGALLGSEPSRVLDLACGPGLYDKRLARLGHTCHGIDFGPASIAYAREHTQGLACTYELADLRMAAFGEAYDLAMLIYGEFNVFRQEDIADILRRAWRALRPGGALLLEPATFEHTRERGTAPSTWYASEGGLWSSRPHLCLEDHHWDPEICTSTTRFYIVDAETGEVARYAQSEIAYTEEEFRALLAECGFEQVTLLPGLTDDPDLHESWNLAILAHKPTRQE